jgi:hypothetical protein
MNPRFGKPGDHLQASQHRPDHATSVRATTEFTQPLPQTVPWVPPFEV